MAKEARCGGCPLFSMCGGDHDYLVYSSRVGICPHCLYVLYYRKSIHIQKLCPGIYLEFIGYNRIRVCSNPDCSEKELECMDQNKKYSEHRLPGFKSIKFEERPSVR